MGSEAKRVAVRCVFAIGVVCWANSGDFFHGFDPMVSHHFSPPFGEDACHFSNNLKHI